MSRNSLVLDKAEFQPSPSVILETVPRAMEYADLVRQLLQGRSVVAVIGSGVESRGPEACRGIATEAAASGKHVVIVDVGALLRSRQVPDVTGCLPGRAPNVFLWPSGVSSGVDFFQSSAPERSGGNWLGLLRRNFDSVVLDCPPVETAPATAEIAALADAAVLVVEACRATKQKIERDQAALQLRGVKLAGCVLMQRR